MSEQQRHDISDNICEVLKPLLPGQKGQRGGIADDSRRFIDGFAAEYLLADRGYDINHLIDTALTAGIQIVMSL